MITSFALHIATGLQILIGALTTALGAALSGKNVRVPLFSTPQPITDITELDISRNLHPRRRIDSCGIIPCTLAEYERAPGITREGGSSQSLPAGGRGVSA
jgi:hypothetical protein